MSKNLEMSFLLTLHVQCRAKAWGRTIERELTDMVLNCREGQVTLGCHSSSRLNQGQDQYSLSLLFSVKEFEAVLAWHIFDRTFMYILCVHCTDMTVC